MPGEDNGEKRITPSHDPDVLHDRGLPYNFFDLPLAEQTRIMGGQVMGELTVGTLLVEETERTEDTRDIVQARHPSTTGTLNNQPPQSNG